MYKNQKRLKRLPKVATNADITRPNTKDIVAKRKFCRGRILEKKTNGARDLTVARENSFQKHARWNFSWGTKFGNWLNRCVFIGWFA